MYATWKKKRRLYADAHITFIPVSNWLADCCRKSSLLRNEDVRVIPNAFPIDTFTTTATPPERKIILMGAARLDDDIKGLNYAIDALNIIVRNHPDVCDRAEAVFFGDIRDASRLDSLQFPHRHLGRINNGDELRRLYASSTIVLSTSLYETLPGTLIEGQAAGCIPVSFGRGGQSDIIDHLHTGYIARYKDAADIASGIIWALDADIDRSLLHQSVRKRFSSQSVTQAYISLFSELYTQNATR